jgi:tRNA threonylcarbamoyladenosine modification (KEOPS) complex  Pcc1 subunit
LKNNSSILIILSFIHQLWIETESDYIAEYIYNKIQSDDYFSVFSSESNIELSELSKVAE